MAKDDWKLKIDGDTFDIIDLPQFRSCSFMTVCSFIIFLALLIMNIALFASDVYTCIKLLAFDQWSSIVKPTIPFSISKWIFAGCILFSVVLMIWEVMVGVKEYKSRNIALSYVNNFSRTVYSLLDYNKFCLFTKINPEGWYSWWAYYVYFEFNGCLRLLLADSPRQVINGLTLFSVLHLEQFNAEGFVSTIRSIATQNRPEAVILSFMAFSFVLWLVFIFKFALACLFSMYVYFRLIQIERMNGLKQYVCINVAKRVEVLTVKYHRKALERLRKKASKNELANFQAQAMRSTDTLSNLEPSLTSDSKLAFEEKVLPTNVVNELSRPSNSLNRDYARQDHFIPALHHPKTNSSLPVRNIQQPNPLHSKRSLPTLHDQGAFERQDMNPFMPIMRHPHTDSSLATRVESLKTETESWKSQSATLGLKDALSSRDELPASRDRLQPRSDSLGQGARRPPPPLRQLYSTVPEDQEPNQSQEEFSPLMVKHPQFSSPPVAPPHQPPVEHYEMRPMEQQYGRYDEDHDMNTESYEDAGGELNMFEKMEQQTRVDNVFNESPRANDRVDNIFKSQPGPLFEPPQVDNTFNPLPNNMITPEEQITPVFASAPPPLRKTTNVVYNKVNDSATTIFKTQPDDVFNSNAIGKDRYEMDDYIHDATHDYEKFHQQDDIFADEYQSDSESGNRVPTEIVNSQRGVRNNRQSLQNRRDFMSEEDYSVYVDRMQRRIL